MTQPAGNQPKQDSSSTSIRAVGVLQEGNPAPQLFSPSTFGIERSNSEELYFQTLNDMLEMQAEIMSLSKLIGDFSEGARYAEVSGEIGSLWLEGANELQKAFSYLASVCPEDEAIECIVSDRFYFVVKQFAIVQQKLREEVYGFFLGIVPSLDYLSESHRSKVLTHIESSIANCHRLRETATEEFKLAPAPRWYEDDGQLWLI